MSLRERVSKYIKDRRQRLLDGGINSIPSPFVRFRNDFLGWEQSTYYLITSFTKGGKTQLVSHLLFDALLYCYYNEKKTGVSIKVLYFPLEETEMRIMMRFQSWLLNRYTNGKVRVSPSDLRSSNNEKPLAQEVIDLLETDEIVDIINYFEAHVIFSEETNPTGIYKFCKEYAENHGKVTMKPAKYKDELGMVRETTTFSHYDPNDPNEYVIPVIDTVNLMQSERGFTKKQAIDKMSEYCITLRDRYWQSPVIIQQQNTDNESVESIKFNRTRPTTAGLGDSKYTAHDANIVLGIFSPFRFGLKEYLGYPIDKFKDHFRTLEVLVNRDGELGGIIGLFFDGATCNWWELPRPDNTAEMGKVYAYLKSLQAPAKSFLMIALSKIVNRLQGN